ncbi:MAG: Hsp20/alpha crystallin family protein [Alphaproteobacteria bacterium]
MELVRWEPFNGFTKLHSLVNDLFEDGLKRSSDETSVHWSPAMDILESNDAYIIRADLPGFEKDALNVEIKDGTLTLSGQRKSEELAEGVQYRSVERVRGKFVRSVILPKTVNADGIQASYKDGILEIQVPKAEKAKPRQITVH